MLTLLSDGADAAQRPGTCCPAAVTLVQAQKMNPHVRTHVSFRIEKPFSPPNITSSLSSSSNVITWYPRPPGVGPAKERKVLTFVQVKL